MVTLINLKLCRSVWKIELQGELVAMHLVKFNSTVFGKHLALAS